MKVSLRIFVVCPYTLLFIFSKNILAQNLHRFNLYGEGEIS
jgi:hypothetical protein